MKRKTLMSVQAQSTTGAIRVQQFKGNDHVVIPITALVEGVLHPGNSEGSELALADEFAKVPDGWNGRPVLLNHPQMEGVFCSANITDIVEQQVFGTIFNTKRVGNKLECEAWVDMKRLSEVGGEAEVLINKIKDGKVQAEVSTGLFATMEEASGVYKGEEFKAIWREVVPDHLAILSEGTLGACSIEDGCGTPAVTANARGINVLRANVEDCGCGCKGAGTCKDTTSVKAQKLETLSEDEETHIFKELFQKFKSLVGFRDNREMSHQDTKTAVSIALSQEIPDDWFYVVATYADRIIYVQGWNETLYQRGYNIDDAGVVTLASEKVQVRPVTDFVPVEVKASEASSSNIAVNSGKEEVQMKTREQRVQALIDNKAFEEKDRTMLMTLEESVLEKLDPEVEEETVAATTETVVEASVEAPVVNSKPVTTEEYIAAAPEEIRALLSSSLKLHRERREAHIASIKANSKLVDSDLKALSDEALERLATSLAPTYAGQGAGNLSVNSSAEDEAFTPPPAFIFETKASA